MRTLVPFLALLALLFFAAPAHADEADAADLVRQAKTAETVDRDFGKARDLYRRAMEAAGDTPLGLDATVALARLEAERGARSEAMRLLMQAVERHPSMDPDAKKK